MRKNLSYLLFILYTSLFSACENEIPFQSKIQEPFWKPKKKKIKFTCISLMARQQH